MARNKLTLEFKAFEEYAERLDELGGDLVAVTEKALQNSRDHVTPKIRAAMRKHHRTGTTEEGIADDAVVHWYGSVAEIKVGFTFPSGFPSVFLMYGTPRHGPVGKKGGHPGTDEDKELYDTIYGNKTKKEIAKLQEKTFARAIKKVMGG